MKNKVCFIGHKNIRFTLLEQRLTEAIIAQINKGCDCFMIGTHGNFDILALKVCRSLRKVYKHIKIEVVITSLHQIEKEIIEDEFGKECYVPYEDVDTIMFDIEEIYFKRQIIVSNQKMVDECDTLICYVNQKNNLSGAKRVMNYAINKGLKIINLFNEFD